MKPNFADQIASEMDRIMKSEDHQKMFSASSMIKKLAFTRVADEGKVISEIEQELSKTLNKTAEKHCDHCSCEKDKESSCKCDCHEDKSSKKSSVEEMVGTLLSVSEQLDNAGFAKFAAYSALLANHLVVAAKEKKDGKSDKSKSKSKTNMKDRMAKMRAMKDKKKPSKSSDKKSKPASSKKSPSKSTDKKSNK